MTKQLGLITLGDVPQLAGNDRSATIAIAQLDDNLRDPRYGKFKIQQSDVDGWRRNLDEVFGGRVAIDFDHSSDRGRGTKAAAWITGIGQQGNLVTANVEFTPSGAKAVRDGDYRMISPTFVQNYVDEHGISHGRALLGAALTNRPVLRKGMPTLSLSRAADKQLAKAAKKLGKKARKKQLARQAKKARQLDRKMSKKLRRQIRALAQPSPGLAGASRPWGDPTAGQASGAGRVPRGLDRDGLLLHTTIARKAAREGVPYFEALSRLSGNDSYRRLSDIPPAQTDEGGLMTSVDPDQAQLYTQARALAIATGISWNDAVEILQQQRELAELQADDGSAPVDWLDSSERPTPPRPWSDEDWARDKRRAAAAGVQIDHAAWLAGAELGVDAVGQLADAQRADRIATLKGRSADALGEAQRREDARRVSAINDELTSRARQRTQAAERAAAAPSWHSSYGH
jgi:hypothetical protein